MQGEVYVEHKYVNLVEIRSVVFKIREVEIVEILVRVNSTRVLRATFLAARHTTVCLNEALRIRSLTFITEVLCLVTTVV